MAEVKRIKHYKSWEKKKNKLRDLKKAKTQGSGCPGQMKQFVPHQHGFNFVPSTMNESNMNFTEENGSLQSMLGKRKINEGEEEKCSVPWYQTLNGGKLSLKESFVERFKRNIVRATATNNVTLLRELLREKSENPNTLLTTPPDIFDKYPSQTERFSDQLNYALLIAVSSNSCEMVALLLEAGANVSHFNSWYPFILNAVDNSNLDLLKILLKYESDPNASRPGGSALHTIAKRTDDVSLQMGQIVLDAGANVNFQSEYCGFTPLHEAVIADNTKMVQFFLDNGAKCDIKDSQNEQTPLHWAASAGLCHIITILLDKGADLLAIDKNLHTPWMLAMQNGHEEVSKLLCKLHDINATDSRGRIPLHFACAAGCVQSVNYLLQEGAKINAIDNEGATPLMNAVENGKSEVVSLLTNFANLNVNHINNEGLTALHIAVKLYSHTSNKSDRRRRKILNSLLSKGANINMPLPGNTSMVVSYASNETVREWLLENGANANTYSDTGDNILFQAVLLDYLNDDTTFLTRDLIVKYNIDISKLATVVVSTHDFDSALQRAFRNQCLEMVQLLINSGADASHLLIWLKTTETGQSSYLDASTDLKSYVDSLSPKPLSLVEASRCAVLRNLGHKNVCDKISQLFLPKCLCKFLSHEVFLSWKEEDLV